MPHLNDINIHSFIENIKYKIYEKTKILENQLNILTIKYEK